MLTKINRQDCITQYTLFPLSSYNTEKDEVEFFYPPVFKSYILNLPSRSFKGNARALGVALTKLTKATHSDNLIFLGDTDTPWLYQQNDYKPVQEAMQYLADKKIGKRFNGALQVNTIELPEFIRHLSWLIRCNGALPCFYFTNPNKDILANICQYGNLHLDTIDEKSDDLIRAAIDNSQFTYGDYTSCTNWLGRSGAISGRKIII